MPEIEVTGSSQAHKFAILLAFSALAFAGYQMWAWRNVQSK